MDFKRGERIVVENLEILFLLEDMFLKNQKLDGDIVTKLKREFMEFVAKFRHFDDVTDLSAAQIVYAKDRGWMLIDWQSDHMFGQTVNPFFEVWESLKYIAQAKDLEIDADLVESWRFESDDVIAHSRNQSPEVYRQRTYKESRNIMAGLVIKRAALKP